MKLRTAILAAAAATPLLVHGAEPPVEMETLVVTATRSEQDEVRLPAAVHVITAAEIAASGARHLTELLRSAGSLQLTDFYGDGSRAQVDARGFGDAANANTLVLVDGRRLNNPDIAGPDLNSIALKDIERIEIIEGSAGALYGDQATGGVINIITRAPKQELRAEASGGSFGTLGARVAVGGVQQGGGWSGRLSAEHRGSDNYREHNHVEYRNDFGRVGYDWASGGAFLEADFVEEDLQTPGALFADEVDQDRRQSTTNYRGDFSDTETRLYRAGIRQELTEDWTLALERTYRKSHGVFRLSSVFGASTQDSFQTRSLRSLNPKLTGTLALFGRDALFTLGGDFQIAEYELSSPFGVQQNEQRQNDGYAQAVLPLPGALDLTVAGRHARVRNHVQDGFTFTQPTEFSDDQDAGQVGLSWRPLDVVRLFARADRNFRYAKVDEFTFTDATPGSNENTLKNQTGETLEAGMEWATRAARLSLSWFRLDTDDEIAFDPTGGPFGFGANINLPETRRDGALVHARWQALDWLALSLGGQYVDAEVTKGPGLTGREIPLVASKVGQGAATLALPHGLSAQAGVAYTGRRAYAGDFDNSLPPLPSHSVTHLSLGWEWRALSADLRINNLLDREFSEYGASSTDPDTFAEAPAYLPSPGRSASLSVRWEL